MTTTDVMIGAAIVVIAARQVRAAFREQLQSDGPVTVRDLAHLAANAASGTSLGAAGVVLTKPGSDVPRVKRAGWGPRAAWLVSALPRLVFLVWLYDVTDGAAFSPFAFLPGMFGSSMWQPVVMVLGLTEVVGRGCALVLRHAPRRRARPGTR